MAVNIERDLNAPMPHQLLDPKKVTATDANRTQTRDREAEEEFSEVAQDAEAEAFIWLPPRDSNPDMLIQSQLSCR
jgi:hypothetical protein